MTERLNSMFEPTPTFSITEDITLHALDLGVAADLEVVLPKGTLNKFEYSEIDKFTGFQVFATVHQESENSPLNLSPATRSRFTEIRVVPYLESELTTIIVGELKVRLPAAEVSLPIVFYFIVLGLFDFTHISEIADQAKQMLLLRSVVVADPAWSIKYDIVQLLRWIDFICNHHKEVPINIRVLMGARYLLLFMYSHMF